MSNRATTRHAQGKETAEGPPSSVERAVYPKMTHPSAPRRMANRRPPTAARRTARYRPGDSVDPLQSGPAVSRRGQRRSSRRKSIRTLIRRFASGQTAPRLWSFSMRQILVLGAGHSAPFLIQYLLERAATSDFEVTVADLDGAAASRRVAGHPRGKAMSFDLGDDVARDALFAAADIVVSLLPAKLQPIVARHAIAHRCHMVSASYRSAAMRQLDGAANGAGCVVLCEVGLDPGIDIMSAQAMIDQIHSDGGQIDSFYSYGGGLPEPSFQDNPLRYVVTWNPRNVAMAGESGACFLDHGEVRLIPPHRVFEARWDVEVPGLGTMDAYGNRDAMSYRQIHGLEGIDSLVRGTLRYPGYCHFWHQLVRLGLPNEQLEVPDLGKVTWADFLAMHLPPGDGTVEQRTADFLALAADDPALQTMDWLGLFSDQSLDIPGQRPSEALTALLERRLPLGAENRDMVVLHHEMEVTYGAARRQRQIATFIHYGDAGGHTAMAQTVGLPAALAVELLLSGAPLPAGVHVPVSPAIYRPILDGLASHGMRFVEAATELDHKI